MEEHRNTIVFACVAGYMLICIGIGLWAMRRTKSSRDFFMAGHSLGIMVTGIAVFSSTLSGFGFVGGPGLVYKMGISSVWMVICASIGFCLSFHLLAKRIRLFAEVKESISLPDLVAARYQSELSRLLTAVAIILGVMAYLGTQIKAMALVMQSILSRGDFLPNISLEWCVVISSAVLVFYCVTGGIIASVYTDLFQGLVMVVAAVLVFLFAAKAVPGGFTGMSTVIAADDPEAMSPWGTIGILGCLSWYFLFAFGGTGQPHIITKMMMNRKVRDARFILPVSMIGYGLSALLWISIGLAMRALVLKGFYPDLVDANTAAPDFLQQYTPPLLCGVVFAGLFAAIMSTADGFLNVGAAAIVHDIPQAIWGRSIKRELLWARIATLLLAVIAAIFSLYSPDKMIALLGAFGWGIFAAAIVPVVTIGLNWKRGTALAANVAISTSLLLNFGIMFAQKAGHHLPYHISGGAVSLLASTTIFFAISLLSKPKKLLPLVEAAMDV
jgi:SSS family transporter